MSPYNKSSDSDYTRWVFAPYTQGRLSALKKYAGAATGALTGGALGALLPQFTDSVWERPLRSLGGATLGAILARDEATDPTDAALSTGYGHFTGSVLGGLAGGLTGSAIDALVPGPHAAKSYGTLGGLALGGTLGGLTGARLGAQSVEKEPTT